MNTQYIFASQSLDRRLIALAACTRVINVLNGSRCARECTPRRPWAFPCWVEIRSTLSRLLRLSTHRFVTPPQQRLRVLFLLCFCGFVISLRPAVGIGQREERVARNASRGTRRDSGSRCLALLSASDSARNASRGTRRTARGTRRANNHRLEHLLARHVHAGIEDTCCAPYAVDAFGDSKFASCAVGACVWLRHRRFLRRPAPAAPPASFLIFCCSVSKKPLPCASIGVIAR